MDTVTWNDDKIDALDGKVDVLTTQVNVLTTQVNVLDGRVNTLEKKVDVGFVRTDERFKAVNQQLGDLRTGQAEMNEKFDALNRTLLQIAFALLGTSIAGIVVLIGTAVMLIVTR